MNPKQNLLLIVLAASLAMGIRKISAESVSVLLQKGIFAEETEGDLNAAIAIYNDIVSQTDLNRAIAAQALYRLGLCHLKLGNKTEAASVLNKLVSEYTEQESLVALAREQLGESDSTVAATRVWSDAIDIFGRISSDGRYYAFTDWTTGDLAIRNLESGENRVLTQKGNEQQSEDYALTPIFSPNSQQIAYSWWNSSSESFELRVISLESGEARVVNDSSFYVLPTDWSPDGTQILAELQVSADGDSELSLISVADGSVKTVKPLENHNSSNARFSPDGSHLAYDRASETSGLLEFDIFIIELESGRESVLLQRPADEKVVEWANDGNALLFSSDHEGGKGLWSVQIDGGVLSGNPKLLKAGIENIFSLGLTRDGDFFYGEWVSSSPLFQTTMDLGSGKALAAPREVVSDAIRWALSPDGHSIANWTFPEGLNAARPKLSVFDLETRKSRKVGVSYVDQMVDHPVWSKDSGYIFQRRMKIGEEAADLILIDAESGQETFLARDATPGLDMTVAGFGTETLVYVHRDPQSGSFTATRRDLKEGNEIEFVLVEKPDNPRAYKFAVRSDLNAVFYVVEPKEVSTENPAVVYQYGLETGRLMEVTRRSHEAVIRPGPDPSFLAVSTKREDDPNLTSFVSLFNVSGETAKELWTTEFSRQDTRLGWWTPDGRNLLVVRKSDPQDTAFGEIWALSANDGGLRLAGTIQLSTHN